MSFSTIPMNLSDRNYLHKPTPRYTEERNSIGSPSPPRPSSVVSHMHLNPHLRVGNPIKYYEHLQLPHYRGMNPFPHFHGMEGVPTRLSSSLIPCNFECGSPHLPTLRTHLPPVVSGSHYGYHPYFPMKIGPAYTSYDYMLYSSMRKPKRIRTAFSPDQLLTLEKAFEKNHYVVGSERNQLSKILRLSETQVKVWFQNRRTKHKRQKQDGESCSQKTEDKDCLDCKEESSSDEASCSDDETISRNPSPVESESCESSPKIVSKAIWNPIMIEEKITPS